MIRAYRLSPSKPAFTLIELLITVAIFGILAVALVGFLSNFLQLKFNAEALSRIRQEGNTAMDKIDFYLRNSRTLPNVCDDVSTVNCIASLNNETNVLCTNTQISDEAGNPSLLTKYRVVGTNAAGDNNGSLTLQTGVTHFRDLTGATTTPLISTFTVGGNLYPLQVSNISFSCRLDPFTNGYIVTSKFTLTYRRRTLRSDESALSEVFTRQTAIRNVAAFID